MAVPPTHIDPKPLWRQFGRALCWAIALLSLLVSAASLALLGMFIFNPDGSEEFTVSRRPTLYHDVFENDEREFLDTTYQEVIGFGHNSGGRIEATLQAIIFGADVIEVDVVEIDGELYAAHTPPLPIIGPRFFRGPTLEEVWFASYRTTGFMLDLKEDSPSYLELVAQFIEARPLTRDIIVASRSPEVLATLRERVPDAVLLLSVSSPDKFATLQTDETLQQTIDGVTMRESLINVEEATWLYEHELLTFAWTVNDIGRANELIRLGVDGITTDNLALLALFAAPEDERISAEDDGRGSRARSRQWLG